MCSGSRIGKLRGIEARPLIPNDESDFVTRYGGTDVDTAPRVRGKVATSLRFLAPAGAVPASQLGTEFEIAVKDGVLQRLGQCDTDSQSRPVVRELQQLQRFLEVADERRNQLRRIVDHESVRRFPPAGHQVSVPSRRPRQAKQHLDRSLEISLQSALRNVAGRAVQKCLGRQVFVPLVGHQDGRDSRVGTADLFDELQSVGFGKAVGRQDQFRRDIIQLRTGRGRVLDHQRLVAEAFQHWHDQTSHRGIVFDDQNARHLCGPSQKRPAARCPPDTFSRQPLRASRVATASGASGRPERSRPWLLPWE